MVLLPCTAATMLERRQAPPPCPNQVTVWGWQCGAVTSVWHVSAPSSLGSCLPQDFLLHSRPGLVTSFSSFTGEGVLSWELPGKCKDKDLSQHHHYCTGFQHAKNSTNTASVKVNIPEPRRLSFKMLLSLLFVFIQNDILNPYQLNKLFSSSALGLKLSQGLVLMKAGVLPGPARSSGGALPGPCQAAGDGDHFIDSSLIRLLELTPEIRGT